MTSPSTEAPTDIRRPLAEAIITLAATPDDVPDIADQLETIALLAAERIAVADYAAIAAKHDDGCCTVATSGELVEAVAEASPGAAAPAPGATTMNWPGFRDTAADLGMGLVSVPLFAGSGATVASLDLYGRELTALAPLTAGICAAYDPELPLPDDEQPLDAGSAELVAGFAEAVSVRATIQLALSIIMRESGLAHADAYLKLRLHAADIGADLLTAATAVIADGFGN